MSKADPNKCDSCGCKITFCEYAILDKEEKPDRALMRFWCKINCSCGYANERTIELPKKE